MATIKTSFLSTCFESVYPMSVFISLFEYTCISSINHSTINQSINHPTWSSRSHSPYQCILLVLYKYLYYSQFLYKSQPICTLPKTLFSYFAYACLRYVLHKCNQIKIVLLMPHFQYLGCSWSMFCSMFFRVFPYILYIYIPFPSELICWQDISRVSCPWFCFSSQSLILR